MDPENKKIKRSLRSSIRDGAYHAGMVGFGESFFSAFALFVGATPFQLGLLGSIPRALGSLVQIFSEKLLRWNGSRKKTVLLAAIVQLSIFLPLAFVPLLSSWAIYAVILLVSVYWMVGMLVQPIWNSWMGDMVSPGRRGKYFGKRNKMIHLTTFASFVTAGVLLAFLTNIRLEAIGFGILFIGALLMKALSAKHLSRQVDPLFDRRQIKQTFFSTFLRDAAKTHFGRLVTYLVGHNFFVFIAAPFYAIYMLQYLQMPYWMYTIILGMAAITKSLTIPIWGRIADKYGTRRVLSIAAPLVAATPLFWIVSPNLWWLLFAQIVAGFAWAGFEISTSNFLFETTTAAKRTGYTAYANALTGMGIFAGAMLGAWLIDHSFFAVSFFTVFLVSALGRFALAATVLPLLKEVRTVQPITNTELFLRALPAGTFVGGAIEYFPIKSEHMRRYTPTLWMWLFDKSKLRARNRIQKRRRTRRAWNNTHLTRRT